MADMNERGVSAGAPQSTRSDTLVESRHMGQWSSLVEIARHRTSNDGGARCFTFLKDGELEEGSLSYESLDRRARALAVWLRENGESGDRALLLHPPGLDFLVAFFGCLYAGIVAVPLYPPRPNRRDSRIVEIAKDADARFALTTSSVIAKLDRSVDRSPELAGLLWRATDELSEADGGAWRSDWSTGANDVAYLQYTSGSTRSPQGVMVTQANVLANVEDVELTLHHPPESVFVSWLPHFHDMGLVYGLLAPWCQGFPCYFMPPASFLQHPARWLAAVSRYRGTHSGAPNFAYDLCTRRVTPEQKDRLDLRSWMVAFNGAEPVRASTLDAFASAFASCGLSPGALRPTYGLGGSHAQGDRGCGRQRNQPAIAELERAHAPSRRRSRSR